MDTQFYTIGALMLFVAMLPGPDFVMVTKNTIMHSRRSGLFTSLGVGSAILIHIAYCALGLAVVISNSLWLFNIIKYIGAGYLIYLGVSTFMSKQPNTIVVETKNKKFQLSDWKSFRQGFFCNLLNPKATLFFLALFTLIIKPETSLILLSAYAIEMFCILVGWFCILTIILSHPRVLRVLNKCEKYIAKVLGIFLVGFGTVLAVANNH